MEKIEQVLTRCLLMLEGVSEPQDEVILSKVIDQASANPIPSLTITLSDEEREYILAELVKHCNTEKAEISSLATDHEFWWAPVKNERLNGPGKGYWNRYKHKLIKDKFPYLELDQFTDKIIDFCEDPLKEGAWDRRGLVVGHVQSGKTANYIGLISKAVDAGYKLIVVVAGIHNSLRNQTQVRIERDFIGKTTDDDKKPIGVGLDEYRKLPNVDEDLPTPFTLTTSKLDFGRGQSNTTLAEIKNYKGATIVVVKKNKSVLEALISWLSQHSSVGSEDVQFVSSLPMLLIDDEADNASLNTNKDETNPTTLNRLIRIILNMFEQKSYVGYTATPYANIYIPEVEETGKEFTVKGRRYAIGDELFPKDFIINIKPGSNYFGAARIFGSADINGTTEELDLLRIVEDQNENSPFPTKINKKNKYYLIEDLPDSLKEAIHSHIIAAAIKIKRGDQHKHCSMMIHVAHLVLWIDRVASLTEDYVLKCRRLVSGGDEEFMNTLKELFLTDFVPTTREAIEVFNNGEEPRIKESSWDEVKPYLVQAVERFKVFSVHGSSRKKKIYSKEGEHEDSKGRFDEYMLDHKNELPFDYNDKMFSKGLFAIAVGGNRLSRGITVEGLTTTYYLRVSKLYDTLMQMGRWFGYRPGYVDLCRIYTTHDLVSYYRHIVHATEQMRNDFEDMAAAGKTPKDYKLKVMTHPSFLSITAAGKMRSGTCIRVKFSGSRQTTYYLTKKRSSIESNIAALRKILNSLDRAPELASNGLISFNGEYGDLISEFVKEHVITEDLADFPKFDKYALSRYIRQVNDQRKIVNWRLSIGSNTDDLVNIENEDYPMPVDVFKYNLDTKYVENVNTRVRNPSPHSTSVYHALKKNQLISPSHEYYDLNISKEEWEENSNAKRKKSFLVKKKRNESETALILIYLLDPRAVDGVDDDLPLVGYHIVFPELENEEGIEYYVNARGNDLGDDPDDDYDDEDQ